MSKIDELLIEMFECKRIKSEFIRYQKYESAASARDTERSLSEKLYKLIIEKDDVGFVNWVDCEKVIDKYCQDKYGFSYNDSDSLIQLKRQINLKDLGI
jgi:hypothetical protein